MTRKIIGDPQRGQRRIGGFLTGMAESPFLTTLRPLRILRQPQGELSFRADVTFDEVFKRWRQIGAGKIEATHDLPREIFRYIFCPTLNGVESDNPNGIAVLAGHQIGDGGFEVAFFDGRFAIGAAQWAKIIDHDIDGLIVAARHNRWRPRLTHFTQLHEPRFKPN
jgi:hypothetical protein